MLKNSMSRTITISSYFDVEKRAVDDLIEVRRVAAGQIPQRFFGALRSAEQALAIGIFAQLRRIISRMLSAIERCRPTAGISMTGPVL